MTGNFREELQRQPIEFESAGFRLRRGLWRDQGSISGAGCLQLLRISEEVRSCCCALASRRRGWSLVGARQRPPVTADMAVSPSTKTGVSWDFEKIGR